MYKAAFLMLCCITILWGCQTIPPDIKELQDKNGVIQERLRQANDKIKSLEASNLQLEQSIAELERVKGVLGQEKSSRVVESTLLRGQIRRFVQSQIDNLKQFLLASDLLDYVGGELVKRYSLDDEPTLVLDLYNKIPRNGSLTGMGAYFQNTGKVSVKILRPIKENFVVVWVSPQLKASKTGVQWLEFPVSVGVESGDVLAYYLSEPNMVSFDSGTGDSRYMDEDIVVGDILKPSSMDGEERQRAYSIGVNGLLNVQ